MRNNRNQAAVMLKRHHHHVWKSYLKAWASNDKLFCLQQGRVFRANVIKVGAERDFYKLPSLNRSDIEKIKFLLGPAAPHAQAVEDKFLAMFSAFSLMRDLAPEVVARNPEMAAVIDQGIHNTEEDFFAIIENGIKPILDDLKRKETGFYDDPEKCGRFLHFLALQALRTKGMKERFTDLPANQFDMDKYVNIIRQIYATRVGGSLFYERQKRPLLLLENETDIPFITGDQPVINLFSDTSSKVPPKLLAYYYPITPWLAILLDETEERTNYGQGVMTSDQVSDLNRRIYDASYSQVYGNTADVLNNLMLTRI